MLENPEKSCEDVFREARRTVFTQFWAAISMWQFFFSEIK